jgi:hypothetical protein
MQRQAMGVALHIVLLPFLNYCIAQLIRTTPTYKSRLFLPLSLSGLPLKDGNAKKEAKMRTLTRLQMSDPIPTDPVPVPDPIPKPQPIPDPPFDPDPRPIIDPPPHR